MSSLLKSQESLPEAPGTEGQPHYKLLRTQATLEGQGTRNPHRSATGVVQRLVSPAVSRLSKDRPPCGRIHRGDPKDHTPRLHLNMGCGPRTDPWKGSRLGRGSSCLGKLSPFGVLVFTEVYVGQFKQAFQETGRWSG